MATVRISQLTAITAPTDDDVLIINDADTNTRKITFANLTQNLVNTTAATQVKSGALTVNGTLAAAANFVVDTNTFFVDSVTNRVGVRTISPNTELDIDGTVHIRNSNTLQFGDANDSNYVSLGAPSVIAANFALTLPASLPAANNLLWSSGSGQLGYTTGIAYDSGTQAMSLGQAYFTNQGSIRFYEQSINGSEYVGFTAPANLSSTSGYTLPGAYPAASGHVLASSTGGVLSWVSNGAGAAGAVGDVQFSDGSTLTSNSSFNFINGSQTLNVPNLSVGTFLEANGNVQLGNATGDDINFAGSAISNLQPKTTGTHDLGTNVLHWAEIHVDDVYAYGNIELGNATSDTVSVNGRVDTDIVPEANNVRDLGSSTLRWAEVWAQDVNISGNTTIGDAAGDILTLNAELASDIIPSTDGTRDLGSSTRRFAEAHVNILSTYGTTTIGDTNADVVLVNGVFQSNLVASGSFDLGTSAAPWAEAHITSSYVGSLVATSDVDVTGNVIQGGTVTTRVQSSSAILSGNSVTYNVGVATVKGGAKVLVLATDAANGNREFYEYFIVSDGTTVSEVIGSNVQAPTAGVFLTTPTAAITSGNLVITVTNTAASGNDVQITAQIISL